MRSTTSSTGRRLWLRAALTAAVTPLAWRARAMEQKPPAYIVVGFAAGGGADIIARLLAPAISSVGGQPIVVENRPGAGGRIAIMAVKLSPRDGNRIFFGSTSVLTLFPHVFRGLQYSLEQDFTPISTICSFPYAIVVSPKIGVSNLPDLIAWAKANPRHAFFGTPGVGTPQHLIGSYLGELSGARFEHVPFKSGAEATEHVLSGQIPIVIATTGQFYEMHKAGRVRIVAITAKDRIAALSEVATCAESGYPQVVFVDSFGLVGPAGMPADTVRRWESNVSQALEASAFRQALRQQVMQPLAIQGDAYVKYLQDEKARWGKTVKMVNFKPLNG